MYFSLPLLPMVAILYGTSPRLLVLKYCCRSRLKLLLGCLGWGGFLGGVLTLLAGPAACCCLPGWPPPRGDTAPPPRVWPWYPPRGSRSGPAPLPCMLNLCPRPLPPPPPPGMPRPPTCGRPGPRNVPAAWYPPPPPPPPRPRCWLGNLPLPPTLCCTAACCCCWGGSQWVDCCIGLRLGRLGLAFFLLLVACLLTRSWMCRVFSSATATTTTSPVGFREILQTSGTEVRKFSSVS